MNSSKRIAAVCAATLGTWAPAWAAYGQIDNFGASASTVTAGGMVDFFVDFSLTTSASQYGGSNHTEPAPQEGWQTWDINWYYTDAETLTAVTIGVGGQSQTLFPGPAPGSSHSGSLQFSMSFDTPGTYQVDASGSWESWQESTSSTESAWRTCWYNDPDAHDQLFCDGWTYEYHDFNDSYSSSGGLGGRSLTITVTAVPEPATLALWAGGLALVARQLKRRSTARI